jgi:outer membrane protein assembly factor BamD
MHTSRSYLPLAALLLLCLAVTSLTGCAKLKQWTGFGGEGPEMESAEDLAQDGLKEFNHGRYHAALEEFEKLKEQYPFSRYSLLADLKIADSNYYLDRYEEARALYEEFEKNHPTNEAIPYVLFQIGMTHFKRIGTIDRDPAGAAEAIQAFSRLLRTFPQSPYTEEATANINVARNFLAAHELYVAKFYLRTGKHEQAASRLEYLLVSFPEAEAAPEARELLAATRAGDPPGRPWHSWIPLPGFLNPFSW